ncbi:unnamed protein product, partial [Iphiclides podalirius]
MAWRTASPASSSKHLACMWNVKKRLVLAGGAVQPAISKRCTRGGEVSRRSAARRQRCYTPTPPPTVSSPSEPGSARSTAHQYALYPPPPCSPGQPYYLLSVSTPSLRM